LLNLEWLPYFEHATQSLFTNGDEITKRIFKFKETYEVLHIERHFAKYHI
jgi:hypothetical protein